MIPLGILGTLSGGAAAGAYELISTTVLSSTATSVTFSSIPSTYKHLQIRATSRNSFANIESTIQFNGDTANNYSHHYLQGDGSAVTSGAGTSTAYVFGLMSAVNNEVANAFGSGVVDILDYADTSKYKTTRSLAGVHNTGNKLIQLRSGSWRSTSAISSVTIAVFGQSFQVGSRFSLYGIK